MRNVVAAIAALAAVGLALPIASPAQAETSRTVIIKRGGHHDHGWHRGWNRHHHDKVVIVKKQRRYY